MKLIIVLIVVLFTVNINLAQNNLPRLKEATEVESGTTEITIRAKGLGIEDADDIMTDAENDAKRAAVYFVLYQHSTPLLQTLEEKKLFSKIENSFFNLDNIGKFITHTGTSFLRRIKTRSGIKVEKQIRVNIQILEDYLIEKGIKKEQDDLASILDNPSIMIIPDKPFDEAIQKLKSDDNYKQALAKIQEFFTTRGISIKSPEQAQTIAGIKDLMADDADDISHKIARKLMCDIYLKYNIDFASKAGGKKAAVNCQILKTTTSEVLASTTGHSHFRPYASDKGLIEEAVSNALHKAINMLIASWKKELKKGSSYLLTVIFNNHEEIEVFDAQEYLITILENLTADHKETEDTNKSISFEIFLNPKEFRSYRPFYKKLREMYNAGSYGKAVDVERKGKYITITIE